MLVMGVDPGVHGAIVVIDNQTFYDSSALIKFWEMPMDGKGKHAYDIPAIVEIISTSGVELLVVEQVTRPASLVRCMGIFEAIGITLGIKVMTARPQVWKKHYRLTAAKTESIALAKEKWPNLEPALRKKVSDGIAEAALIGDWGYHASRLA
jgi:hypothetical protein